MLYYLRLNSGPTAATYQHLLQLEIKAVSVRTSRNSRRYLSSGKKNPFFGEAKKDEIPCFYIALYLYNLLTKLQKMYEKCVPILQLRGTINMINQWILPQFWCHNSVRLVQFWIELKSKNQIHLKCKSKPNRIFWFSAVSSVLNHNTTDSKFSKPQPINKKINTYNSIHRESNNFAQRSIPEKFHDA